MENLILVVAIASAVMGGVFFTFSTFVMTALGNLKPAEGIRAMQRINIDVFCWPFTFLFFGLPALFLVIAINSVMHHSVAGAFYLLTASVVYLAGSFLSTIFGNVPLNNQLAKIDASTEQAIEVWQHYLVYWVRWNHLRTVACVVASVLLLLAIR